VLKEGEYLLNYSQIFALNKLLPAGLKFELEENISRQVILNSKPQMKRQRAPKVEADSSSDESSVKRSKVRKNETPDTKGFDGGKIDDSKGSINAQNSKRSLREKKPTTIKDLGFVDKDGKGVNSDVQKKCEKIFGKLRKHPLFDSLNASIANLDAPNLITVEKNLRAAKYTTVYQFGMDVRKIWNFYFSNTIANSELYQKVFTLSNFFEEMYREVENSVPEEKTDIHELNRKVSKLQEKFNELHKNPVPASNQRKDRPRTEKPMTVAEKNQLGTNIRLLNPEQLKGIIKLLSDSLNVDQHSKYFEFDIETLCNKKLRELEKYVRHCLKTKTIPTKVPSTNPSHRNTKKLNEENEKIAQLKVRLSLN
jgi:hypothetical protein